MVWALLACTAATTVPPGELGDRWNLVWEDGFKGAEGDPIDPDKWVHDVGGDGWGNDQLEFNTDRTENSAQDGQGFLRITAIEEDYESNTWTSARIKTQDRFEFTHGRVEASMRLPEGQGFWPAFWMLGADFESVGWPACGEIDVMEFRGDDTDVVHGTVHGPGYSGAEGIGDSFTLPEGDFSSDFHLFAVEWDPQHITWEVDGEPFHTLHPGKLPEGSGWVFDHDFFLILNLAVGGHFLDNPDDSTPERAQLVVDYVNVYERAW